MADWLTRRQRSHNMASIRSVGNRTTEQAFAKLLRLAGISGWRRHISLPGKPDFVFPSRRLAVFLDGCFWHGCPKCYRLPSDNRMYWRAKLSSNIRRDKRVVRTLRLRGWDVVRIWEHQLERPRGRRAVLSRITRFL